MIPRSYAPNSVVGVDLFQLPNFDGADQFWMLNMVCHGTSFQLCERVKSKEPAEVWAAFSRSWGRLDGLRFLSRIKGQNFLGDFKVKCSDLGILLRTMGARAPHQQGRTERHGALFKAVFQKAIWDCPPQDHHEWRLLLRETEASFNRSGFSPMQRMMGHSPTANGEVMSDDVIDPAFLGQGQEMERLLSARRAAQKAFVEINTPETVKTALRSRSRVQRKFSLGVEREGSLQAILGRSSSCLDA